ncbi:MAG: FAD-dependent oxidoreductase [Tepidisphaeraceae bacterium]
MSGAKRIAIIGNGLAGPLLACFLARDGHDVTVYERRGDPRVAGFSGGRSINLALSARGIDALSRIGLADDVLRSAIPMRGRMLHEPDGRIAFQYYSSNHTDAINSVSRAGLNLILLTAAAKYPNVRLEFDHRCVAADLDRRCVTFENGKTVEADLIIGADGAYSVVRQQMTKLDRFDFEQSYLEHGYKELSIPPTTSGEFAMEPNALHIWPRGGYMMIALPNQDRSFTCTCFWPLDTLESLKSPQQIGDFFRGQFADAVPLMPTLVEDYLKNPTGSLVTIRCWPWQYQEKVVLLGDAAHAIVPFYGQGMNAAFEDCVVLGEMLRKSPSAALDEYARARKPNTDAIADMALHNFVEMRDHVASPVFLMKKKLEHGLHRLLPHTFVPLYDMISFSTIPYAAARRRAGHQSRLLKLGGYALAALIVLAIAIAIWT